MDYHHKYLKYKNKYLQYKQNNDHLSRITKTEKIYQKMESLNTKLKNEIISVPLVNEIIEFFQQCQNSDYNVETMHMLEDDLMRKYIGDISGGKITSLDLIQKIATQIHKLIELDYMKWYA